LCQTPGLETTVNSPFHILYGILKRHFDNSNQGVSGVVNIILKLCAPLNIDVYDLTVLLVQTCSLAIANNNNDYFHHYSNTDNGPMRICLLNQSFLFISDKNSLPLVSDLTGATVV
jgi:hypothetical protein